MANGLYTAILGCTHPRKDSYGIMEE